MKTFTVKDFITYNNPCFSCGSRISFSIASLPNITNYNPIYIKATVSPERTEIDLKVTYNNTLQLWIFHKSNKILSSDMWGLTDYLASHKLFLSSRCDKCFTIIESDFLDLNLSQGFISPVGIELEVLFVKDDKNTYNVESDFIKETSIITVRKNPIDATLAPPAQKFYLSLLPLYKIKSREYLINKAKTYLTFS